MNKENIKTESDNAIILSSEAFKNIVEDIECVKSIISSAYEVLNMDDSLNKLIELANVRYDVETFSREMPFGLIDEIKREIERLKLINEVSPLPRFKKVNYSFVDYLKCENNELFAEALKEEFKAEKPKGFRIMIEALVESELLKYDDNTKLLKALNLYFRREIGSRVGIFNCKFDISDSKDLRDFKNAKARINTILLRLQNTNKTS